MKTTTKLWIAGGGLGLVGLYYLGKRVEARSLGGLLAVDAGFGWPSWLTGQSATDSPGALRAAAQRQISAAQKGQKLTSYLDAPNRSLFWTAPATVEVAHIKAAYWLAVASRVSGKKTLASAARRTLASSGTSSARDPEAVEAVYSAAASKIEASGASGPSINAVLKVLGSTGTSEAVIARRRITEDRSSAEIARGTIQGSASDAATGIAYLRGFVTGEKPAGASDAGWFFTKWGVRVGLGVGALLVLRVAFSSEYKALKTVASTAITKAKQAAA